MRRLIFLALCSWLALPVVTFATDAAGGHACENATSTAAMRECENVRLKQADDGMNVAYRALSARLDQRGQEKLHAAQEAWLKFRAAEANYQADSVRDGTLAPLIAASVAADMTELRRIELEKAAREIK